MKSIRNMRELIYHAKHQKDDIPAPRVKALPLVRRPPKKRKPKSPHEITSSESEVRSISSRMVEYDDISASNASLGSSAVTESDSAIFGNWNKVVPVPFDKAKKRQERVERKKHIAQLRKQERKLIKQVNRPPDQHVIKNAAEFVQKREKDIQNLFKEEMELMKDEDRDNASRSQLGASTTAFTSALTSDIPRLKIPTTALSEQTLEDDIKRDQKQLVAYRKMVDPTKIKRFNRPPPKLPKLALWKYLYLWDVSSNARRDGMILNFIEQYVSIDPIDMDGTLSHGGSLIFARFVVGMQLSYERRKQIWHYFQAISLFIKSLQGERFIHEFSLCGGFATAFSALKIDEMKIRDKANVLFFLYRTIEGPSGTRVKNFICKESSYLDSVVDCLTMCDNIGVIHFAQLFLENMCIGTKIENLIIVANYIISLLPCDFNPRVQIMACQILTLCIHQKGDLAARSYKYVVDVLKTDYDPILVPVGELCIAIMSTPSADELLTLLIEVVEPTNLTDDLAAIADPDNEDEGKEYAATSGIDLPEAMEMMHQEEQDEFDEETNNKESEFTLAEIHELNGEPYFEESVGKKSIGGKSGGRVTAALNTDMHYRQQLGAIFVLGFMLKNRVDFADWMMQKGIIGSILTAIGSSSYLQVQLKAIRLLMLIHDLTPDCVAALSQLLPRKLVGIILDKGEGSLEYITAVHCSILRKLGRLVQKYWQAWFNSVALPPISSRLSVRGPETAAKSTSISSTTTSTTETSTAASKLTDSIPPTASPTSPAQQLNDRPISSILLEIRNYTQTLEDLIATSFDNIITSLDLIEPEPNFFKTKRLSNTARDLAARLIGKTSDTLTIGEQEILSRDSLEAFRKYLNRMDVVERTDEFEKYYTAQFGTESEYEMGGMEMAALQEAEKALGKLKKGTEETGAEETPGEFDVDENESENATTHGDVTPVSSGPEIAQSDASKALIHI